MNVIRTCVAAIPVLAFSSIGFAAESAPPPPEPTILSAAELDGITAGDPFEVTLNNGGFLQIGNIQGTGGYSSIKEPVLIQQAVIVVKLPPGLVSTR